MGNEPAKFKGTSSKLRLNQYLETASDTQYDQFINFEGVQKVFESHGIEVPEDAIMAQNDADGWSEDFVKELCDAIAQCS